MTKNQITRKLVIEIIENLAHGKRVRQNFYENGKIDIDRTLPFLVVYRRPDGHIDAGTDRLIKGEASYLIASASNMSDSGILNLIIQVGKALSNEFGAFLIIDIWSTHPTEVTVGVQSAERRPYFKISVSRNRPPTEAVDVLQRSLGQIRILKRSAVVEIVDDSKINSDLRTPIMSETTARRLNCYIIGLEIDPIYRNPVTDEIFPMVLNRMHRSLSAAFKKTAFEFARKRTNRKLISYHALGRRAFVKTVWNVDRKLAEISQSFDFLLQVTPINIEKAWMNFKRSGFQKIPTFYYRPQTIDPALMKRKLYEIPVESIEDATLGFLFSQQRKELDRQLSLLQDRGTRQFYYGALQLYGEVSDDLVSTAMEILEKSANSRKKKDGGRKILKAGEFAEAARIRIEQYRKTCPELAANVQVRDDIVGLIVSKGDLLVSSDIKIAKNRVEAMLSHEVGTHIVTYYNGKAQPFRQLYCGLPGYDELQEGLAVLSEYLVGQLSAQRLSLLSARVLAAYRMQTGKSFLEVFDELRTAYGFEQKTVFIVTSRIFRGGGLVKDAIYLRGLINLLAYLKNGGKINHLFCGKISLDYIRIIEELRDRQILISPPLEPLYMKIDGIDSKLAALYDGLDVFDLVKWG